MLQFQAASWAMITATFYYCPVCQLYTIKSCGDNFTGGEETVSMKGPLEKVEGDERVELIRRCERP